MEKDHTMHTIHSKSDSLEISLIRQGVSGDDRRPAAEKLRDYYFTLGFNLVQVREFLLSWSILNTPPLPEDEVDLVLAESLSKNDILSCLECWNHIRELEITLDWIIDRIIPKESLTVIFGKGGIGKTWLAMDIARSIGAGIPFLGLATIKTPVIFIDFENPLAMLNVRTQKLGHGEGVYFWRVNNNKLKAPKLDSKDWELYKNLPNGAVLIFDTLRAAQGGDENASDEMGLILGRLKELRDMGFTVILLHHTAKNSDRIPKGSTAIVDLADHILGLTLVRKKKDGQEIIVDDDGEIEEDVLYRFGVREKTRFEPYHIYLTLNPDRGFELAPDPQEETLQAMHRILTEKGTVTKTAFLDACKGLGIGLHKLRNLFGIGQGRYWKVDPHRELKNAQFISPIQLSSSSPLYSTEKLKNYPGSSSPTPEKLGTGNGSKFVENTELFSFSEGFCQTEKQDLREIEI